MRKTDFFNNIGGLNVTDSPFTIRDNQASSGWNYEYSTTGAITKSRDRVKINTVADLQTRSLGLGLHNTKSGTKTLVRVAGTKLQSVNISTPSFTDVSEDTAVANSDFFSSSSTQPVIFTPFNTASADIIWAAGGGATSIYGYTGSNVTANGVAAPTGTFTLTNLGAGTGGTFTTGSYYYAIALRKTGTQALSNAALDQTVTVAGATETVQLTFPTGVDATKYDKWYVYRSAVSGVTGFTTGTLVAQVTVGTATYTDVGNVAVATSQVVPRAGNTTDNSVLPSGTYKVLTTFKRRLVTAQNSTFYLSDLDKPESWPSVNNFTIPTGGNITGVAVISSNTQGVSSPDEFLVIFKETEVWAFTGNDADDWILKFVDSAGCISQSLIVPCNGFICWLDYRGVYMWSGSNKPVYCSRPIEASFYSDGDLDKSKLGLGWGVFYRKTSQVVWFLSHRIRGENKYILRLDLRLSSPQIKNEIVQNVTEGVFTQGFVTTSMYSGLTYLPDDKQELFLSGDSSGFIYKLYNSYTADGEGITFEYETNHLNLDMPAVAKRFRKVVVWIDEIVSADLTLNYWADYKVSDADKSVSEETMAPKTSQASLWDLAVWDVSSWDEYMPKIKGITFNLHAKDNNVEGDAIKLKFIQDDANVPVIIHGYTVFWEEIAVRK
jgi:hypothetical protein